MYIIISLKNHLNKEHWTFPWKNQVQRVKLIAARTESWKEDDAALPLFNDRLHSRRSYSFALHRLKCILNRYCVYWTAEGLEKRPIFVSALRAKCWIAFRGMQITYAGGDKSVNSPYESWFADSISSSLGWRRTSIFRSREWSSLVCRKRNSVLEIAMSAISSMVLEIRTAVRTTSDSIRSPGTMEIELVKVIMERVKRIGGLHVNTIRHL